MKSPKQKKAQPSLAPQAIDVHNWYYESPGYITIVHEVRDAMGWYVQTDQFKIRKTSLLRSIARMNHR